jgi:hypothetical protein
MNALYRSIAVALYSLAFACAMTEAEALSPFQLNVNPLLPTPSKSVVIEIRTLLPFDPSAHCMSLFVYKPSQNGSGDWKLQSSILSDQVQTGGDGYFLVKLGVLSEGRYEFSFSGSACGDYDYREWDLDFTVTSTNGPITVVEYFDAALGHYFITADAHEIAVLDSGQISGWTRTGETFHALPAATMPSSAAAVCRYYGLPSAGLDTHFFTDNAAECAAVPVLWPDKWILETDRAFGVEQDWWATDYFCEDFHRPLYRLYNNRADANHRYTVSARIRDEMIAKGWINEGRYFPGSPGAFSMCVPL